MELEEMNKIRQIFLELLRVFLEDERRRLEVRKMTKLLYNLLKSVCEVSRKKNQEESEKLSFLPSTS